jgi:hypothetical protein
MTAIAALTLADGQATPANKTFSPVNIDSTGVAKWADRSGGIAFGFNTVSMRLRTPVTNGRVSSADRVYRLNLKVNTPVLEVTSASTGTGIQPAPTKAYEPFANIELVLPERSTLQQRKDLLAYVKNLLSNAVVTQGVENFEQVY